MQIKDRVEVSGFDSSGTNGALGSSPDLRRKASGCRDLMLVVIASSLLADHSEVFVEETRRLVSVETRERPRVSQAVQRIYSDTSSML
ncbi:hypothetical protein Baya_16694 [Bagarius yarrelli]|uniref:Uncharacterized protein n=1 Tax=Bagarius yarrelli TaxID=175774 RepID=A0A556VXN9_BAGYA|nr:hypothetical protein Baya_16694 [Bagarius yarrelli]